MVLLKCNKNYPYKIIKISPNLRTILIPNIFEKLPKQNFLKKIKIKQFVSTRNTN
jgi:hypothetical protein